MSMIRGRLGIRYGEWLEGGIPDSLYGIWIDVAEAKGWVWLDSKSLTIRLTPKGKAEAELRDQFREQRNIARSIAAVQA